MMKGAQLKAIRERRDWSQEQMAKEIGVSRVLLGQMERDQAPIEPRTEYLVNRMREFMVDLRSLEPQARSNLKALAEAFNLSVPGGNSAELVGLRAVETGEVMGICRIAIPLSGDDAEQREQVEAIFREYVPCAVCEVWDYEHKYRCGLISKSGVKVEVSFVRRGATEADVRFHAAELLKRVQESGVSLEV